MDPALARRVLGLKGSTDCPHVAGISKVVEDEDQSHFRNRSDVTLLETHGREDRLGCLGVGDLLQDADVEGEDPYA
jgi:hypothetical protein